MEHSVLVNILRDDKSEDEVEVYFETDDLDEIVETDGKIAFIREQARKQYESARKIYFCKRDLKELQKEIDEINNISGWHNDETYDEFIEQGDFY